jgi:hypothetical protein
LEIKRVKYLLNELSTELTVYSQLYGSKYGVSILNDFNPMIFRQIQKSYINSLFMSFSRLLDPASQGSNKNLTLEHLIKENNLKSDSDVQESIELVNKLYRQTKIKDYRNKLLGHSDLKAQLGDTLIETNITPESAKELLSAMYNVVNIIEFRLGKVDALVHSTADMVLPRDLDGFSFLDKLKRNV